MDKWMIFTILALKAYVFYVFQVGPETLDQR